MQCEKCEKILATSNFTIKDFSEIEMIPPEPGVYFIIVRELGEQLDKILAKIERLKILWPLAWKNAKGTLQRLAKLKQHLKACNTIYIGSSIDLEKRINALSLHTTLAHVIRPAIYALTLHGWRLALAYRTWTKQTITQIAETLEIPHEKVNKTTMRQLFHIIQTLVGYAYYT